MLEPKRVKWQRRATTIPVMLGATAIAILGLAFIAPALGALDLMRARRRLPSVRVYLFMLQYMINDSVEIVVAPIYWAIAGFGTRLTSEASIARHERLQRWSLNLLEKRSEQLLGLRLDLDEDSIAAQLSPGPVIVIARHVSLFDASVPGIVCERSGFRPRAVIMAELLADPGFDLIYSRIGSVFIPRDDGPNAVAAIEAMTAHSTHAGSPHAQTAFIIFPEGRIFEPAVRDRALARLAEKDPERAARLDGLTHVLPPRPGGLHALLTALPNADVVMLHHTGLDRLRGIDDLAAAVPIDGSIDVTATRIDRADIPSGNLPGDDARFGVWLDDLWLRLDADLAQNRSGTSGP